VGRAGDKIGDNGKIIGGDGSPTASELGSLITVTVPFGVFGFISEVR